MIAAHCAGATEFLTLAANCREALASHPARLRLVRVASVDDALAALAALRAGSPVPGC